MSKTICNPADSTQMFTWGTKGRKPKWVSEGIANGSIKVPEDYLKKDEPVSSSSQAAKVEEIGLKAWKWVGVMDIDPRLNTTAVRCVVVANDEREAVRLLNRTMVNPVSRYEFDNFWKKINNDEFSLRDNVGVFEMKDASWVVRKELHKFAPIV